MTAPPAARATVTVWAVLVAATVLTVVLHGLLGTGSIALAVVLVITFGKVWLVGRHFMELRDAPVGLRRAFDGYVVVVAVGLVAITVLF